MRILIKFTQHPSAVVEEKTVKVYKVTFYKGRSFAPFECFDYDDVKSLLNQYEAPPEIFDDVNHYIVVKSEAEFESQKWLRPDDQDTINNFDPEFPIDNIIHNFETNVRIFVTDVLESDIDRYAEACRRKDARLCYTPQ